MFYHYFPVQIMGLGTAKITTAVGETNASQHKEGPVKFPLKALSTMIVMIVLSMIVTSISNMLRIHTCEKWHVPESGRSPSKPRKNLGWAEAIYNSHLWDKIYPIQFKVTPIGDNVWLLTWGLAFKKKNQSYFACLFPFFASFI